MTDHGLKEEKTQEEEIYLLGFSVFWVLIIFLKSCYVYMVKNTTKHFTDLGICESSKQILDYRMIL